MPQKLLARFLKTLRQSTTGFALLGAHQHSQHTLSVCISLLIHTTLKIRQFSKSYTSTVWFTEDPSPDKLIPNSLVRWTPTGARWLKWLEREFTDRKARGSNPTSASRLPLSRLGQPGSLSALVLPLGGMAAKHRKGVTAEQFSFWTPTMALRHVARSLCFTTIQLAVWSDTCTLEPNHIPPGIQNWREFPKATPAFEIRVFTSSVTLTPDLIQLPRYGQSSITSRVTPRILRCMFKDLTSCSVTMHFVRTKHMPEYMITLDSFSAYTFPYLFFFTKENNVVCIH
ncbi:hypothetical protein CSKR_100821 [Clonorchis sinensis]|uniref:Uncharacterized protein n=1 Tax=Clonorchis sinensis TaxID=79923 RepID=A0A419QGA8_CLOSI|nr:hypothetical protein CSKR_100821 [Clonorchis sinensis]